MNHEDIANYADDNTPYVSGKNIDNTPYVSGKNIDNTPYVSGKNIEEVVRLLEDSSPVIFKML